MKKIMIYTMLLCIFLILLKYFISDYKIEYKVKDYNIKTIYADSRFYFELKKDYTYNFDIYSKRKLNKTLIKNIIEIKGDNFLCIYPIIDGENTYPLCVKDNEYVDYSLIDSNLLDKYKKNDNSSKPSKDFEYYKNLNKDEYIAIWNYKGYMIMNNKTYENVSIFKKDRYDNTLAYELNGVIYMPNYDEEHEFSSIKSIDLETKKVNTINIEYVLDYDSYIVGNIKKKIYIFDNKNSILYEFNTRNNKIKEIGNNELGYEKYNGKDFVTCSKTEYKVNKIKISNINSNYIYIVNNGVYKQITNNEQINTKIFDEDVSLIKENNNELFYLDNGNVFKYTPYYGSKKILYNYELIFNNENSVFVYIK